MDVGARTWMRLEMRLTAARSPLAMDRSERPDLPLREQGVKLARHSPRRVSHAFDGVFHLAASAARASGCKTSVWPRTAAASSGCSACPQPHRPSAAASWLHRSLGRSSGCFRLVRKRPILERNQRWWAAVSECGKELCRVLCVRKTASADGTIGSGGHYHRSRWVTWVFSLGYTLCGR